jgi:hypothetical protein
MDVWATVGFGVLGGALPDILRLIRERYGAAPAYLKSWYFWLGFLLMLVLGGFVAWVTNPAKIFEAIACGFTAPAVLQGLGGDKLAAPTSSDPQRPSSPVSTAIRHIRYWWSL